MSQQYAVDPFVTDNEDVSGALVHNAKKGRNNPTVQVTKALSAGETITDEIALTLSMLRRIPLPGLLGSETFPHADVDFPEPGLLPDRQTGFSRDDLGRHQASLKITAVNGVKADPSQTIRQ